MALNSEIEDILSLKSVDVYHLSYNSTHREYELNSVIRDQCFRIFREVIDHKVDATQRDLSQRLALIKCKDWFYPLEKDNTRVFRFRDQKICYLFPDVSNPEAVSIVVINTEAVDDIKILLLENVLLLYCEIQDSPQEWKAIIDQLTITPSAPLEPEAAGVAPEQPMETAEPMPAGATAGEQPSGLAQNIANNIIYGAEMITNGLTYGTQVANDFVKRNGAQYRAYGPSEPIENKEVDPRVVTGLRGLRKASHAATSVTGFAVNTVAKGTNQLGKCLAPHVKRHSKKLISSVSGKSDNDSEKICDNIFTVASGGLHGFSTLYNGIAQNVFSLAKTVTNETVSTVSQKYGSQAADATEQALYTAGNSAIVLQNVQQMGPKAIAKRTAFDTGKTVLLDKDQDKKDDTSDKTYPKEL